MSNPFKAIPPFCYVTKMERVPQYITIVQRRSFLFAQNRHCHKSDPHTSNSRDSVIDVLSHSIIIYFQLLRRASVQMDSKMNKKLIPIVVESVLY